MSHSEDLIRSVLPVAREEIERARTSGPWRTLDTGAGWEVVNDRKRFVADCTDSAEAEGNTRLIALAPELADLARLVADHFDMTDAPLGLAARALLSRLDAKGGA